MGSPASVSAFSDDALAKRTVTGPSTPKGSSDRTGKSTPEKEAESSPLASSSAASASSSAAAVPATASGEEEQREPGSSNSRITLSMVTAISAAATAAASPTTSQGIRLAEAVVSDEDSYYEISDEDYAQLESVDFVSYRPRSGGANDEDDDEEDHADEKGRLRDWQTVEDWMQGIGQNVRANNEKINNEVKKVPLSLLF